MGCKNSTPSAQSASSPADAKYAPVSAADKTDPGANQLDASGQGPKQSYGGKEVRTHGNAGAGVPARAHRSLIWGTRRAPCSRCARPVGGSESARVCRLCYPHAADTDLASRYTGPSDPHPVCVIRRGGGSAHDPRVAGGCGGWDSERASVCKRKFFVKLPRAVAVKSLFIRTP